MKARVADQQEARPAPRGLVWIVIVVAVGAAIAMVGRSVVPDLLNVRDRPSFPSLADNPDSTLQGTVAYFDDASGCVRIVAAAGRPSKDVFCLPPLDPAEAKALGKPIGPQLVWLDGGRLEVTMFRMTDPPGPGFAPGWQKIVDVRTGAVTDVSAASVPSTPNLGTRPTVNAAGDRLVTSSDPQSGRITVGVNDAAGGSRTLLDVRGPGKYTYGLIAAFWSPDGRWVLADDGRILAITLEPKPLVRVLSDATTNAVFGGDDPRQSRFAVTAENLVPIDSKA